MKVAVIGCGNMGTAYIKSLLKDHVLSIADLLLIDKNPDKAEELGALGDFSTELTSSISDVDVIIAAVKPQFFKEMAAELKPFLKEEQVVVSIMAGITIAVMEELLDHTAIVRAMPNTPCQIGKGITSYTSKAKLSSDKEEMVETILKSTGQAVYIEDESLIDATTALAGSGPAYFFHIVDQMVKTGVELGVKEEDARKLVQETMFGAYHLMNSSDKSLEELTAAVTSKGGTTAAALNVFKENKLEQIIFDALSAAQKRGKELSEG